MSMLLLTMGPQLGLVMETPALRVGEPGTIKFHAPGAVGQVKWSVAESDLPAEWGAITPDGADATINTAEALVWGEYTITVRAADTQRVPVARTFSVWVEPDSVRIDPASAEYVWSVDAVPSETFSISGGTGSYVSASVVSGSLPGTSMTINGDEMSFYGPVTASGSGSATIEVRDSRGAAGRTVVNWTSTMARVFVGGGFITANGEPRVGVARFNAALELDPVSFEISTSSSGSGSNDEYILPRSDERVIVFGPYNHGVTGTSRVGCYNPDGTAYPGFSGLRTAGTPSTGAIDSNGKIYLSSGTYNGVALSVCARLNADGSNDVGWDTSALPAEVGEPSLEVSGVIPLSSGDVLLACYYSSNRYIVRTNSSGGYVTHVELTNNQCYGGVDVGGGKAVIFGRFYNVGGTTRRYIARINTSDLSVDTSFANGISFGNNQIINRAVLLASGKWLIGGRFTATQGGNSRTDLARLNADGTLDPTFNAGSITRTSSDTVEAVAELPSGRIVVVGGFTAIQGQPRQYIALLEADGAIVAGTSATLSHFASGVMVQT